MKLLNISASGIKGQEFDLALGDGGTAIIGDNATGKTAIVEAIKFVLRGRFSEVKKRSWPELTVKGEFDFGMVARTIGPKGTVLSDYTNEVLDHDCLDIPLLDPEHYFSLTDSERVNYVFSRVKLPDSYTPESILAQLERVSLGEDHTELVEKAKGDLIGELRGAFETGTLQESLETAIQGLRTRFTYWNKRQKETQGAVTTLAELKLRVKETTAAPVDLEKEIKDVQTKIDECNSERGKLIEQGNTADTAIKTKRQYQKWLDEDRTDYDTILRNLRETKLAKAADFERAADSIMGIDIGETRDELQRFRLDLSSAEGDLRVAKSAIKEADESAAALADATECPYCKSKGKDWKKKLGESLDQRIKDAVAGKKVAEGKIEKCNTEIKDRETRIASFESVSAKCETLRLELKKLGDDIDTALDNQKKDEKKRAGWRAEMKEIVVPKNVDVLEKELATSDAERAKHITRMGELRNQQQAETKLRQDLTRAAEAEQEHRIAAAQLLVTKTIAKEIGEKREAMICEVFGKLLGTANLFVKGILKAPLVLHENTIGMFAGSKFVEHYWFSGTEKALAYMAIATALSADAPFKMPILDEFGRLDYKKQKQVIDRLEDLKTRGVIDQYVIAGTLIPDKAAWEPGKSPEILVHIVK